MPDYGPNLDPPVDIVQAVHHASIGPAVAAARFHDTGDP
jgi:hypothetical protein